MECITCRPGLLPSWCRWACTWHSLRIVCVPDNLGMHCVLLAAHALTACICIARRRRQSTAMAPGRWTGRSTASSCRGSRARLATRSPRRLPRWSWTSRHTAPWRPRAAASCLWSCGAGSLPLCCVCVMQTILRFCSTGPGHRLRVRSTQLLVTFSAIVSRMLVVCRRRELWRRAAWIRDLQHFEWGCNSSRHTPCQRGCLSIGGSAAVRHSPA